MTVIVNCNSHTDSATLQRILELPLEKKVGYHYGPAGQKRLVYYIHDLNMPAADQVCDSIFLCTVVSHLSSMEAKEH